MQNWFTTENIDQDTYIISEYRHWEETHCYLLKGTKRSLLIDTGLGICDISRVITQLTDKPVTAVATHAHWDHIGGHKHYSDFYAHQAELSWLSGDFPQPLERIKQFVTERCSLPEEFDINAYEIFQGTPSKVLRGGEIIDLGGRRIEVLHTPGHSPGHMCFWEKEKGCLYTGDLVYKGELAAWFPSTDPHSYLKSLEKIAVLPVKRVCPAHHSLDIGPEMIISIKEVFRQLNNCGKLCHGSGVIRCKDWSLRL